MKGWTYVRAALALCLALVASFGCSGPDIEKDTRGFVRIERAYLGSAGRADLIDARVRYDEEGKRPDCFLVEGPTAKAMRRWQEGGPPVRGKVDSDWASRDSTEQTPLDDGSLLVSFGKDPGADAPDPDRAAYFVFCGTGVGPEGFDEAHVEGTPQA